ncbi:MAG: isohexenylglutaconyl-CoA hydratase [Cognaticolwellia sp.]|jgi:isohexenylglutaconyl-CoA hydratase
MSVTTQDVGGVRTLTLNRPQRRNALNVAMVEDLETAIVGAQADGVRVLVLRGAGANFCSGGDIAEMGAALGQQPVGGRDPLQELNAVFGGLSLALAQCDCVTVSVLQGTVMGGGVGLACATDLSIADESVKFSLPETRLGLVPAQIAPFLVARIGGAQTVALATAGASLPGVDALRIGLIHQLCTPEALEATVAKALERILRGAPGAIASTKQLLRTLSPQVQPEQIQAAASLFAQAARSPEAVEGTTAFLQKRAPSWAKDSQ